MTAITMVLMSADLVLWAGIVWVISKRYRQTHNLGLVILGCGILVWPLVGSLLRIGTQTMLRRAARGEPGLIFPFSLIADQQITTGALVVVSVYAYQIVQAGLILAGLLSIGRSMRETLPRIAGNEG